MPVGHCTQTEPSRATFEDACRAIDQPFHIVLDEADSLTAQDLGDLVDTFRVMKHEHGGNKGLQGLALVGSEGLYQNLLAMGPSKVPYLQVIRPLQAFDCGKEKSLRHFNIQFYDAVNALDILQRASHCKLYNYSELPCSPVDFAREQALSHIAIEYTSSSANI